MKQTIIVNNGSTSKKYAVYSGNEILASFTYEKTHDSFLLSANFPGNNDWNENEKVIEEAIFSNAFGDLINTLLKRDIISSGDDIEKVAIRIVAPGDFFQEHKIIDKDYLLKLDDVQYISPLHISPVKDEIDKILERLPKIKLIAISDSEFHKTMPRVARTYALPKELTEEMGLYRFGYHGISVSSVINSLKKNGRGASRVIVCHLGGGASITAVKDGESIDTTMGFSPLEGLPMATRSGSIDPNAIISVMNEKDLENFEMQEILYKKSGIKGMTGTSDTREVLKMVLGGDKDAELALDLYTYNIAKYIASYYVVLGGLDAIVFTGTIGERAPEVRRRVLERLESLGVMMDKSKNKLQIKGAGDIKAENSKSEIYIIPTEETEEMLRIVNSI